MGKSTVLNILKKRGYTVIEEQARKVIGEQKNKTNGLLPKNDPAGFAILLTKTQQELERQLPEGICFIDRATIDNLAYVQFRKAKATKELFELIKQSSYDVVFLLETPPEDVFGCDYTFATYENSLEIHNLIIQVYAQQGIPLIRVSFGLYEEQANFIEEYMLRGN